MDVKYVEMTGYHGTISKYADSIAKYGLDPYFAMLSAYFDMVP